MAQHDYVISNGTGSAVRSDLNNALSAIVSQNSGATAPATTYAFQFWADTTTNTLKLRNSANSAWIELRQLDGDFTTVSVDNGTAAAPSIYFNASGTDTGIYSSGTDAVDISTAGTRRFGISSSGELTAYGGNLTLNAQGDLRFADSDSSNWVAFQSPATVSSNVTWTLPSADGTNGQALTTNGSGTLSFTTPAATTDKITEGNTEAEVVDTGSDGHFKVTTEGTERFRINSSGNVGIGTTSPASIFHVSGSADQTYTFQTTTAGADNRINFRNSAGTDAGGIWYMHSGNHLLFNTGGSNGEKARIDGSGRLLVGTSTANTNGGVLQISNGITFPATQSAVNDANTLDDYEEGTWTPGVSFGGGTTGITYSGTGASYMKVGDTVYANFDVALSNKGSSTGLARITGLPFTSSGDTAKRCGGYFTFKSISAAIYIYLGNGNTAGAIYQGANTDITNADFANTTQVIGMIIYRV